MTARLLTAEQVCNQFGVPSARTLRTMRQKGLKAVRLGKAYLFDEDDVQAFIEAQKTCPAEIRDLASIGSRIERPGTFSGTSEAKSAFVQLARQTAKRLKQPSPSSSAHVIKLQDRGSRRK